MGVCNCSVFCCTLLYVHSSIAIILMGKRELAALLYLSSWCLLMVEWLFLAVPRGCLRFLIVVFPDNTHLLFLKSLPGLIPFATRRVIFRKKKQLHEHELQLSDYNIKKYFRQNIHISGRKIYIYIFCLRTFQGQNEKLNIIQEIPILGSKYF